SAEDLSRSELLVLPGVGNFAAGMENLTERNLMDFVRDWGTSGKPLVGICLGMQLFFEHSEEGDTKGLGILPGEVVRFDVDLKVPHMGWNRIWVEDSRVLAPFDGDSFYFVHSYVCIPNGKTAATTQYGGDFVSAVEDGRIVGFQFHPEKSSERGLALLERTLEVLE
ncbi:MAG: imidazole glycerol phosphate synthase subunit HisH, partial [Acidimicrobiia bacterium]